LYLYCIYRIMCFYTLLYCVVLCFLCNFTLLCSIHNINITDQFFVDATV
jgi:hypothetical protein